MVFNDDEYSGLADQLLVLFAGLDSVHGVFHPERVEGKKQVGRSITVREPVTKQLWVSHLKGISGLGIVPINAQSECLWAAIDVDNYDLDDKELLNKISKTPLLFCRSKSGGAHLYLFCSVPVRGSLVREYLRNTVGLLGIATSEIFPKQERIYIDRGDVGNWLNMPYFGDTRKCIALDEAGEVVELNTYQFIETIIKRRVTPEQLEKGDKIDYEESAFSSGPPCLQVMTEKGFPEHTRNTVLLNVGVYCKLAFPDKWKMMLRTYNEKLFKGGPLTDKEVETIIKSLDKKHYSYQCRTEPLMSFCNSGLCKSRKYGIASSRRSFPDIVSIAKLSGDVAKFILYFESGDRMEVSAEELLSNSKFAIKYLNDKNEVLFPIKKEDWMTYVRGLLDQSIEIKDETLFSRSMIPSLFQQFVIVRLSTQPTDVANNKVFYDPEERKVRFRLESLYSFIKMKRENITRQDIVMYFRDERKALSTVIKDKLRRSVKVKSVFLSEEEAQAVEEKMASDKVL